MAIAMQVRPIHIKDPAEVIWDNVGDLSGIEVALQQVLIGTYIRPGASQGAKTAGGILIPDKVVDEDRYQGKVGLVLKTGPRAFVDDPENKLWFYGFSARPGDWVVFRPSEGLKMQVGELECRLIPDVFIAKMKLSHPDCVY